jgi:hypothetical protein
MIDKVKSIDEDGVVTFIKNGKDSAGDLATCSAYGYHFINGKCHAYRRGTYNKNLIRGYSANNTVNNITNKVYGANNNVGGYNNCVKGYHNTVDGMYNNVLGNNLYTKLDGSFMHGVYSESNTARNYMLYYSGTTTDATPTELKLINDNRFFIDESYESAIYIESKCVVLDSTNNEAVLRTSLGLYRYANNTLTEVLDSGFVNSGDSGLSAVVYSIAPVASTPDYIEISVTGIAGRTLNYNVVLTVTEVTNV